jgi:hypothetical protein
MECLCKCADIPNRAFFGHTLLYRGQQRIILNRASSAIWHMLSEKKTLRALLHDLGPKFVSKPPTFSSDISLYLDQRCKEGGTKRSLNSKEDAGTPTDPLLTAIRHDKSPCSNSTALLSVQIECMTPYVSHASALSLGYEVGALNWKHYRIVTMHIKAIYRCNLRCVQYYNTTHAGTKSELNASEWEHVMGKLAQLGCAVIGFTGGEVFIRKDAITIFAFAREKTRSFRINRNWSMLTEQLVEQLSFMQNFGQGADIGFYGSDPCIREALSRDKDGYSQSIRGIKVLKHANIPALAKHITMRDTFEGIQNFVHTMDEMGTKYVVSTEIMSSKWPPPHYSG